MDYNALKLQVPYIAGWWFQIFVVFYYGEDSHFDKYFFIGVETTN